MTDDSRLAKEIQELIAEKLAVRIASTNTDLLKDGVLDSVTLVHLILHLEQRFNIRIELAELDIEDLRSVNTIASLVLKLQKPRATKSDLVLAHATGNVL